MEWVLSRAACRTTSPKYLPAALSLDARVVPIYLMLAAASFVDNAVGAWAPTLLIRNFSRDPAQIGVQLGLLLTVGFGGGVLIGGVLADRAGGRGGWQAKLRICVYSGLLILPIFLLMNSPNFRVVLTDSIPYC
jgi:MFS family permease